MKFLTKEEYMKAAPKDKGTSHCPFCFFDTQKERLLRENKHRRVFYPIRPLGGVDRYKHHLLLTPKEHHKHVTSLSDEELLSRLEADKWIAQYFGDQQYFSFIRHTEDIKSIEHIHYHYVMGDLYYSNVNDSTTRFDKENS